MKFAKVVFWVAGLIGLPAMVGLYLQMGPPAYFGLLPAIGAFQAIFCMIGSDPVRYRPFMLPSVVEKLGWVATLAVFYSRGALPLEEFLAGTIPHGLLGVLFVIAYFRTPTQALTKV